MDRRNFYAAVLGLEGCIYGISNFRIIKYNPVDNNVSNVTIRSGDDDFAGGVLTSNGNIYSANKHGQILKVDVKQNSCSMIGGRAYNGYGSGWGRPVLGDDKCLYFPPSQHGRVLNFNPTTQRRSFIGRYLQFKECKWFGAALASNGFIYCIPYKADDILQIDSRHTNERVLEWVHNVLACREHLRRGNQLRIKNSRAEYL